MRRGMAEKRRFPCLNIPLPMDWDREEESRAQAEAKGKGMARIRILLPWNPGARTRRLITSRKQGKIDHRLLQHSPAKFPFLMSPPTPLLLTCLSIFLIVSPLSHAQREDSRAPQPLYIAGASSHIYGSVDEVELRLHVFSPPGHQQSERRAAMVFFFGGGWTHGSILQFVPFARHLAKRGMVAVLPDYRVRQRHGTNPFDSIADAQAAVQWVRENAAELGIDPGRIAAGGGSAGGHLALSTAIFARQDPDGKRTGSAGVLPGALVLFNPAIDTTYDWLAERFHGRGIEASPLHQLQRPLPPTIIFHGRADRTIPYADVEKFVARAQALKSICALFGYEGATHGFFNSYSHEGRWYRETLLEMDRFLVGLGYLPAPSPDRISAQETGVTVHRTMMPDSGPSSFAVGFAPGLGLSYDPGRGGVNYIWRGDFADLGPTWQGKINRPAEIKGEIAYRESVRFPLRIDAPDREPRLEFRGYSLLDDGVEFRYLVDGVLVREELQASSDGSVLTRTFRLGGPISRWYWLEPQPTIEIASRDVTWNGQRTFVSGERREFSILVRLPGGKK
jgi:acetyl esterase